MPVFPTHLGEGLDCGEGSSGSRTPRLRPRAASKPAGTRDCRETGAGVAEVGGALFAEGLADQNQGFPGTCSSSPRLAEWGMECLDA